MRIKRKIRARIFGTIECPRFSVFRSNKYIYAQLIDDANERTLISASDIKLDKGTKAERAAKVGTTLATSARAKGMEKVVFDRSGFKYAGRIKTLAESARAGGLKF